MINIDYKKNVFVQSAELGVPFGLLLTVASMAMTFGDKVPLLSFLTIIVAVVAPVVLYWFQRRRYVVSNGFATYSELWTLAIFTTIGGALITAVVTYLVINTFRPDVFYEQVQMVIDTYKQMPANPGTSEMIDVMQKAVDRNLLPTSLDMCMNMFWLTAVLGCTGGAITAAIAKRPIVTNNTNLENTH